MASRKSAPKAKAAKGKSVSSAQPELRVLFPLDGSQESYAGLQQALTYLPADGFHATLLVVMNDMRGASEDMVKQFEDDVDDEVFPTEDSALVVLRQATRSLREHGVKLTLKIAKGNVRKEILAEAGGHDLLVMHRRSGRTGLGGATALARKAGCSSLIVRV